MRMGSGRVGRRVVLAAAGGTVAAGLLARKPWAALRGVPEQLHAADAPGKELPPFTLRLPDGTAQTLADYAGRGVVLNLWATWCVPCVEEMPSLDALADAVAGAGVAVLPIASDRGGAPAVQRFYAEHGVRHLPVLLDPQGAAARTLGARGIPTTVLIDRNGRERARLEGGADWGSPAAVAMVRQLAA